MISTPKWLGLLAVAFVAGSFIASPELRAYAANTVFSTDIVDGQVMTADLANNAITAAKIRDNEVKAAEIATDAVGASELQGVSKLFFGRCVLSNTDATTVVPAGARKTINCSIAGVDDNDNVAATLSNPSVLCFSVVGAITDPGVVKVTLWNHCVGPTAIGAGSTIGVIAFDK